MNNEEKILHILGQMQGDIKQMQGDIKQLQADTKQMQGDISTLKDGQQRIENTLTIIYNQTARLTEYHTETKAEFEKLNKKVDDISKDVNAVEYISGKNMADIANLKLAR